MPFLITLGSELSIISIAASKAPGLGFDDNVELLTELIIV